MSLLFLTTSKDCAHSAKLAHPTTKRQDHANLMQLVGKDGNQDKKLKKSLPSEEKSGVASEFISNQLTPYQLFVLFSREHVAFLTKTVNIYSIISFVIFLEIFTLKNSFYDINFKA